MRKVLSAPVKFLPALALAFFQPLTSAGTITFDDVDVAGLNFITTSITDTETVVPVGGCVNSLSTCTVMVDPPPAYTSNLGGFGWVPGIDIFAPGGSDLIATLTMTPIFDVNFKIQYFSLVFSAGDDPASVADDDIAADGAIQLAGTITWFSPTEALVEDDSVNFQITSGTPEPSTAPLMLVGFALLSIAIIRRRTASIALR
jgi:hypothetical protein